MVRLGNLPHGSCGPIYKSTLLRASVYKKIACHAGRVKTNTTKYLQGSLQIWLFTCRALLKYRYLDPHSHKHMNMDLLSLGGNHPHLSYFTGHTLGCSQGSDFARVRVCIVKLAPGPCWP